MPNTRVSSRTALSHMQPLAGRHDGIPRISQKTRRHRSHAVWEAPKKHIEPASFSILKGELVKASVVFCRDFIRCFMESSHTWAEQWSSEALFLVSARLLLSDKWQLVSYQWSAALSMLGWRAEEESEEHQKLKKKHCCTLYLRWSEAPETATGLLCKKGAILTLRSPEGVVGNLKPTGNHYSMSKDLLLGWNKCLQTLLRVQSGAQNDPRNSTGQQNRAFSKVKVTFSSL